MRSEMQTLHFYLGRLIKNYYMYSPFISVEYNLQVYVIPIAVWKWFYTTFNV